MKITGGHSLIKDKNDVFVSWPILSVVLKDMLSNFCFGAQAQNSLVILICENGNVFGPPHHHPDITINQCSG